MAMKKDELLKALQQAEITVTAKMTVIELQALLNQHQKKTTGGNPNKVRVKEDLCAGMTGLLRPDLEQVAGLLRITDVTGSKGLLMLRIREKTEELLSEKIRFGKWKGFLPKEAFQDQDYFMWMEDNCNGQSHPQMKNLLGLYRLATNFYQHRQSEGKKKAQYMQEAKQESDDDLKEWPTEPEFPPEKPSGSKDKRTTKKEEDHPPAWDGDETHWDAYVKKAQSWTLVQKAKKEQVQEEMDKEKELYREQIKQEYQRIIKEEMAGNESDGSWMQTTSTGRKTKK